MDANAFFQDLALLMAVGGLVSAVFGKMKWPKVIGYICAGIILGPYTWGGGLLKDEGSVMTIAQLGVVFLMFAMGLDFSPKQMKRVRSVALTAAILDTVVMTWLGYTIGHSVFGWSHVPSFFLGVAICDSATTMLAKVVDELGWSSRPFVKYALGTSVCEDMICVGLVAIATGLVHGGTLSLGAAGMSLGGLFVFLLTVIVAGLILVPRLLKSIAKTGDSESLLLTILGFCFFVSYVAFRLDFSLAIGAFLIGIIGASSDVREKLGELTLPLRSMFAAVFFVSIGLSADPVAWIRLIPEIALVTAVVLGGKFINCTIGALLAGESVATAVRTGMALAQIGEFAFMVALMYASLTGDTRSDMYNIVVAVSLVTTLLNPFLIRASEPFGLWIERRLPSRAKAGIEAYAGFVDKFRHTDHCIAEHKVVRKCFYQLGVIAVLNFAAAVAFTFLERHDWSNFSAFFETHKRIVFCLLVNVFIVSLAAPAMMIARTLGAALAEVLVGADDARWRTAFKGLIRLAVFAAVIALLFCEMTMINMNLAPDSSIVRWAIRAILVVVGVVGWRFFIKASKRAMVRFEESLGAEERREAIGRILRIEVPEKDYHQLPITLGSPAVGATAVTLNIRAKTGASIVGVQRGLVILRNVGPDLEFVAGDILIAAGTGEQIAALKDLLGIIS